jgi:hypothetical protein
VVLALPDDGHIEIDADTGRSQPPRSSWLGVAGRDQPRRSAHLLERWRSILVSRKSGEVEARVRHVDGQSSIVYPLTHQPPLRTFQTACIGGVLR